MEIYEYENSIDDFKMPYTIFGEVDRQVMLARYMKLSNLPRNLLAVRLCLSKVAY
jgi:hypothetical protein